MMSGESNNERWLKSGEVRKELKVSTCELAHLRNAGKLPFKKQGNAYLYRHDENIFGKLQKNAD